MLAKTFFIDTNDSITFQVQFGVGYLQAII